MSLSLKYQKFAGSGVSLLELVKRTPNLGRTLSFRRFEDPRFPRQSFDADENE
jgi:hypothetical protein